MDCPHPVRILSAFVKRSDIFTCLLLRLQMNRRRDRKIIRAVEEEARSLRGLAVSSL